jgi:hypothetical protein
MLKYFFVFVFIITAFNADAQRFPSEFWHEGKVVLLSEDTLHGLIKYDLENDLIQVNVRNLIQTYSSRKILNFEIFDEGINNYRLFYALPYKVKPNYEVPILFEVLYEGPLTLLCREFIVQETVPQFGYYSRFNFNRLRLTYDYYFLRKNGSIDQYFPKRKELLHVMRNKSSEIKTFMKRNNLRYDRRDDLARITAYYNEISGT